jgi:protein-S-isoprenylcysteine O-methyltransferase Ste14
LPFYTGFIGRTNIDLYVIPGVLRPICTVFFGIVGMSPLAYFQRLYVGYLALSGITYWLKHGQVSLEAHRPYLFWRAIGKWIRHHGPFLNGSVVIEEAPLAFTQEEIITVRYLLVKLFFLPLMITGVYGNLQSIGVTWTNAVATGLIKDLWSQPVYMLMFYCILLLETSCFAVSYSFEISSRNRVRSVEPTCLGWFVALICYPPFNDATSKILGWGSQDYADYGNRTLTIVMMSLTTLLFLIYVWASVALNLRASNLTNRGIVSSGPYRFIRHPAYICKNLHWIILGLPLARLHWDTATLTLGAMRIAVPIFVGNWPVIFSLIAWAIVYYARALTEERHLLADEDYQAYCRKVPYRFIPGVY